MSTNEQSLTGESGEGDFEWVPPEPPTAAVIPHWQPTVDSPTSRLILAAARIELASAQWTEHYTVERSRNAVIVAACSGGVDSVVLLHLLKNLRQTGDLPFPVHVMHLDHQLRDTSAEDAEFVRGLAGTWELPFHLGRIQVEDQGEGIEAAARRARYEFLRRGGASASLNPLPNSWERVIVTGHHADDQAETVLLHLVRGSGVEGMAAMRAIWRKLQMGDNIFRPLLRVRRSDIETYARENGLPWVEDESNLDTRFDRNLLRHEVMPRLERLNPQVAPALERISRITAYEAERLKRLNKELFESQRVEVTHETRIILGVQAFTELPIEDQIACLRTAVRSTFKRYSKHGFFEPMTVPDPGIDDLEYLARVIMQTKQERIFKASGPHPWYDQLAWSTFTRPAIFGKRDQLFSIHLSTEPAWVPLGPWIEDEDYKLLHRKYKLPWSPSLQSGWQLSIRKLDAAKNKSRLVSKGAVWFDAGVVQGIGISVPEPGMRIAPLGMEGKHKSIGNLFTDHKIPRSVRSKWPIIVDRDTEQVLWVSWLAQSEFAKVTPDTNHIWEFQWRPETSRDHAENFDQYRKEESEGKPE